MTACRVNSAGRYFYGLSCTWPQPLLRVVAASSSVYGHSEYSHGKCSIAPSTSSSSGLVASSHSRRGTLAASSHAKPAAVPHTPCSSSSTLSRTYSGSGSGLGLGLGSGFEPWLGPGFEPWLGPGFEHVQPHQWVGLGLGLGFEHVQPHQWVVAVSEQRQQRREHAW